MELGNLAAYLGCALAMGFGAIGSGVGEGRAAMGALRGMVRQRKLQPLLLRNMLISQAMSETPAIFAFVIAILLLTKGNESLSNGASLSLALSFIGAGLSVGLGALGAGVGCGLVGSDALESMGRSPQSQGRVFPWMLISQAWAQTASAFALVISLLLIVFGGGSATPFAAADIVASAKYLGMGLCMGMGAIGPALGISYIGGRLCRAMADTPEHFSTLRNTFIVGAAVSESTAVYSLVISLVLMTQ